ncbi:hypothetical protein EVC37_16055 [Methylocaldum sp. BRCS4]|jgi:hypothetical protein|uniref:hypothetical protein n=1 Tax=Methylocaldum sp. 14B TaxID=1912213 RepID=UPI00098B0A09|nr:hypothetical protein [Methylocaldum sp. 14B]MVF23115.1 hypothetical protein [Methylocaldum sp. BRCS4]
MGPILRLLSVFLWIVLGSYANAQIHQPPQPTAPDRQTTGDTPPSPLTPPNQGGMGQGPSGMPAMPMGGQCPMCEAMMQKELMVFPWLVGGGAVLGILITIALALLVVLEIQWIRLWTLRLKAEKTKVPP